MVSLYISIGWGFRTDTSYISTDEGWLYCAAHKDLFNGEIVGYALGSRMTKDLVIDSLLMAINAKKPGPGLIHHSDRGSQYCSACCPGQTHLEPTALFLSWKTAFVSGTGNIASPRALCPLPAPSPAGSLSCSPRAVLHRKLRAGDKGRPNRAGVGS